MVAKFLLVLFFLSVASGATMPKSSKLAPNKGVECARTNPQSANTCLIPGTFCGYYEECPKCVCPEGEIGVKLDPADCTETCVKANLAFGAQCKHDVQCSKNYKCGIDGMCGCPMNTRSQGTDGGCVPPYEAGEQCDMIVGCGIATSNGAKNGLFCHYDDMNTTANTADDRTTCKTCPLADDTKCANSTHTEACVDADGSSLTSNRWGSKWNSDKNSDTPRYVGNCKTCYLRAGATAAGADSAGWETCDACFEGFRLGSDNVCHKCTDPNCGKCTTSVDNCDECNAGYYKDSLNKYICTLKVKYSQPCKDENDECSTPGSECRAVEGVKQCTCIQGYTWNPSTETCIHPDADVNVQVNGTCNYDMTDLTQQALCNHNDKTLRICTHGLECVADCPCVDSCTLGGKTCATPVLPGPQHIFGPPGNKPYQRGLHDNPNNGGGSNDNSAAGRSVTSMTAVVASVALAALFW